MALTSLSRLLHIIRTIFIVSCALKIDATSTKEKSQDLNPSENVQTYFHTPRPAPIENTREGRALSQGKRISERATYNYVDPYAPDPYLGRALAAYRHRGAILPPYAPGYNPYENYVEYLHKKKAKESSVHRNPYETHDAYDAIRTQDADLAPHNPYNNPYLAPLAAQAIHAKHHGPHAAISPPLSAKHHAAQVAAAAYKRYQYDISKIPECAYTNKHYYNLTFCLQDDYYPTETIKYELANNKALVDRLLSDITYQSADNLVDGLTKANEEGYTYEHYYGNKKHQHYGPDHNGYSYAKDYYKSGGYICPSDIFYGRPKRSINTYGQWKVIVNLPDDFYARGYGKGYEKYTQTQRLEQCMYPSAPCSYIDSTKLASQCLQKHNFVRLLAYTYDLGLHIDSFKMPVACSCHIRGPPKHYGHGYGHPVTPVYHGTPTPASFHVASPTPVPRDPPLPPLLARDGPFFLDGAKK